MSWVWYCDEHDTRGDADSPEEAEFVADAHSFYKQQYDELWRDDDELCNTIVYELIDDTRANGDTIEDSVIYDTIVSLMENYR